MRAPEPAPSQTAFASADCVRSAQAPQHHRDSHRSRLPATYSGSGCYQRMPRVQVLNMTVDCKASQADATAFAPQYSAAHACAGAGAVRLSAVAARSCHRARNPAPRCVDPCVADGTHPADRRTPCTLSASLGLFASAPTRCRSEWHDVLALLLLARRLQLCRAPPVTEVPLASSRPCRRSGTRNTTCTPSVHCDLVAPAFVAADVVLPVSLRSGTHSVRKVDSTV